MVIMGSSSSTNFYGRERSTCAPSSSAPKKPARNFSSEECVVKSLDVTLVPKPPTAMLRKLMARRHRKARMLCEAKVTFLGRFYVRGFSEENVKKLRDNLSKSGGTRTRLRLTSEGVTNGYNHGSVFRNKMPVEFVPIEDVFEMLVDTKHTNILLVTIEIAEGHFEVQAYRFKDEKAAFMFQQAFATMHLERHALNWSMRNDVPRRTSTPAIGAHPRLTDNKEWRIVSHNGTIPRRIPTAHADQRDSWHSDSSAWQPQSHPPTNGSVARRLLVQRDLDSDDVARSRKRQKHIFTTPSRESSKRREPSPHYQPAQPTRVHVAVDDRFDFNEDQDSAVTLHREIAALSEEVDYLRGLLEDRKLLDDSYQSKKPVSDIQMNETLGETKETYSMADLRRFEAAGGTVKVKVKDFRHTVLDSGAYPAGTMTTTSCETFHDVEPGTSQSVSIHDMVGSMMHSDSEAATRINKPQQNGWVSRISSVRSSPGGKTSRNLSLPAPYQRRRSHDETVMRSETVRSRSIEHPYNTLVPATCRPGSTLSNYSGKSTVKRLIPVTAVDAKSAKVKQRGQTLPRNYIMLVPRT